MVGVRAGNGVREEMPGRPGRSKKGCKSPRGRRAKSAQPLPETMAIHGGEKPPSASRTKCPEVSGELRVTRVAPGSSRPRSVAQTSKSAGALIAGQMVQSGESERPQG